MSHFKTGISGNDLKDAARRDAAAAGLDAAIYSHALGYHGHGAGPWVGMWDDQEARPDKGDYPVQPKYGLVDRTQRSCSGARVGR